MPNPQTAADTVRRVAATQPEKTQLNTLLAALRAKRQQAQKKLDAIRDLNLSVTTAAVASGLLHPRRRYALDGVTWEVIPAVRRSNTADQYYLAPVDSDVTVLDPNDKRTGPDQWVRG